MFESLADKDGSPARLMHYLNGLIVKINWKLGEFMQGNELGDDATMMAVKIK
jgi:hypothetical protein